MRSSKIIIKRKSDFTKIKYRQAILTFKKSVHQTSDSPTSIPPVLSYQAPTSLLKSNYYPLNQNKT